MTAEDLKIGNLVYPGNRYYKKRVVKIKSIDEQSIYFDALNVHEQPYEARGTISQTKPIPLTQKWLKKLG